jgi:hypothetical protein
MRHFKDNEDDEDIRRAEAGLYTSQKEYQKKEKQVAFLLKSALIK